LKNKKYRNVNKDQMEMDYYEINLLGCKLIKIEITRVKRWFNLYQYSGILCQKQKNLLSRDINGIN
jgi:hypothetical protein